MDMNATSRLFFFLLFMLTRLKSLHGLLFGAPNAYKFRMSLMHTAQCSNIHVHVVRSICAAGAQLRLLSVVTHLANWSRLEIQGVIRFLWRQYTSTAGGSVRQCRDVQATGS
jgi:hypothetical protein